MHRDALKHRARSVQVPHKLWPKEIIMQWITFMINHYISTIYGKTFLICYKCKHYKTVFCPSVLKKERTSLLQVKNNMAADLERLLRHREVKSDSARPRSFGTFASRLHHASARRCPFTLRLGSKVPSQARFEDGFTFKSCVWWCLVSPGGFTVISQCVHHTHVWIMSFYKTSQRREKFLCT